MNSKFKIQNSKSKIFELIPSDTSPCFQTWKKIKAKHPYFKPLALDMGLLILNFKLIILNSERSDVTQEANSAHPLAFKSYYQADLSELPQPLKEEAKKRYKYVSAVLEASVESKTEKALKPIIEQVSLEIEDSNPPSWVTLYRWLKDYAASGSDIRSLIPKHIGKGNRRCRLHPEVQKIIAEAIAQVYLQTNQAEGTDVYERVVIELNQRNRLREKLGQENLAIPNIAAIYRAIAKIDPYKLRQV